MSNDQYDVIVVGTGHAGIEAALAAARMGCRTIAFTTNIDNIGLMPCNPSIGGPAKGQIAGEIDALGGEMGRAADESMIQMKVLNRSRGPAVQCLRSQNDKYAYKDYMKSVLLNQANLDVRQGMVSGLIFEAGQVIGVSVDSSQDVFAKTVVVTTGTFLKGKVHVGLKNHSAGRIGEDSAETLSESLASAGLRMGRLKTGTPPRLDAHSIDYSKMRVQPGDPEFLRFSFRTPHNERYKDQVDCWLTGTTPKTHEIILDGLTESPLFQKVIKGSGPRYCPSIEDKVVRFSDKDTHQIFIEPEGRNTNEIYAQGLNTSLSEATQDAFLRTLPGLEDVKVLRFGYAVEYDSVFPDQMFPTLEVQTVKNLYLAGQINGTSGYEEAGGQGIVAGINAALRVKGEPSLILKREDSFIGTLIDDLITKNHFEPYRMLTSRSEYRLLLRQDNAIFRLSEHGHRVGLLSDSDYAWIQDLKTEVAAIKSMWATTSTPDSMVTAKKLPHKIPLARFLKRPEASLADLEFYDLLRPHQKETAARALVEVKYEGYISKQQAQIQKIKRIEDKELPIDINFDAILGLRTESREKFKSFRPRTIYEAKKIAGINPADIMVLVAYLNI